MTAASPAPSPTGDGVFDVYVSAAPTDDSSGMISALVRLLHEECQQQRGRPLRVCWDPATSMAPDAWPDRLPWPAPKLDLAKSGALTFEEPDYERFPALKVAKAALAAGGAAPAVMNAANEVAVAAFLDRKIGFLDIAAIVAETLERVEARGLAEESDGDALETARRNDATARRVADEVVLGRAAVRT